MSVPRVQNASQISRGESLYRQNCAACHGALAQGAPDWENPNATGALKAPPLNGTGHTWHHPVPVLRQIIKEGTQQRGGAMRPYAAVLTDQQVDDIIVWFMDLWPETTFQGWYRRWHHQGLPTVSEPQGG
jgi:mono/diheme cytochrome c family protein